MEAERKVARHRSQTVGNHRSDLPLTLRGVSSRTLPRNSGLGTEELPESSWLATEMLTISQSARLSKSPDGGVLLDVDRGLIFSLNSVGSRIVELLQQGKDARSVAESIRREFQVSEEIARNDVADFLVTLREQKLLNDSLLTDRSVDGAA